MGFLRKITGVQGQIDAAKQNAAAQETETKRAAQQAEANMMQSAKAAADSQAQLAARSAAEQKASDAINVPLATVDVSVDTESSTTSSVRNRRAKFGRNYNTGVNI
jgi:hypothetical protein